MELLLSAGLMLLIKKAKETGKLNCFIGRFILNNVRGT
jgi:hypothetical protein